MNGHFVFDIDGTLAILPEFGVEETARHVRDSLGEDFLQRHHLLACDRDHFIFPGYYALLRWLHERGGDIAFFSSGIEARNRELTTIVMERTFGAGHQVPYRVFSRQHCIHTDDLPPEEEQRLQPPGREGRRKKRLAGVVVPEEELPHTLLIDDDQSYMVRGEEYNLVMLQLCYEYRLTGYGGALPGLYFSRFHSAFFVAGFLDRAMELASAPGMNLVRAARRLQFDDVGVGLDEACPFPAVLDPGYYHAGRALLRQVETDLDFSCPMPATLDDRRSRPKPIP